jgi:hypothetical protein
MVNVVKIICRVGGPDDVAQTIVFLIENTFVTGTIIEEEKWQTSRVKIKCCN